MFKVGENHSILWGLEAGAELGHTRLVEAVEVAVSLSGLDVGDVELRGAVLKDDGIVCFKIGI